MLEEHKAYPQHQWGAGTGATLINSLRAQWAHLAVQSHGNADSKPKGCPRVLKIN